MSDSTIHPDSAERKRFWIWLVAALLALIFLFGVVKWRAEQEDPTRSQGVFGQDSLSEQCMHANSGTAA